MAGVSESPVAVGQPWRSSQPLIDVLLVIEQRLYGDESGVCERETSCPWDPRTTFSGYAGALRTSQFAASVGCGTLRWPPRWAAHTTRNGSGICVRQQQAQIVGLRRASFVALSAASTELIFSESCCLPKLGQRIPCCETIRSFERLAAGWYRVSPAS